MPCGLIIQNYCSADLCPDTPVTRRLRNFMTASGPKDLFRCIARQLRRARHFQLYVHIPFCELRFAGIVDATREPRPKAQRMTAYLEALEAELASGCQTDIGGQGCFAQRIAFGGGSPNALSTVEFVRLLGPDDYRLCRWSAGDIDRDRPEGIYTPNGRLVLSASNVSSRKSWEFRLLHAPCTSLHRPDPAACH